MATKLYDLAVATGSYKTRDGKEKRTYENVGSLFQSDKDDSKYIMLKATFNPAGISRKEGSTDIFISLFKPREKRDSAVSQSILSPVL